MINVLSKTSDMSLLKLREVTYNEYTNERNREDNARFHWQQRAQNERTYFPIKI